MALRAEAARRGRLVFQSSLPVEQDGDGVGGEARLFDVLWAPCAGVVCPIFTMSLTSFFIVKTMRHDPEIDRMLVELLGH